MFEQLNKVSVYFNVLDLLTVRLIIALLTVVYIAFGVYVIPLRLLVLINVNAIRVIIIIIILLIASRAPDIALIFALAYFTTIQVCRNRILNISKK